MDNSKLANWLQILANLGIVAGLILVGVQINQNTKIAEVDLVTRGYEQVQQYHLAMIGENPSRVLAKAATAAGDLSDEELLVLRGIFMFWLNTDDQAEIQVAMGLVDSNFRAQVLEGRVDLYGGNPVFAAMWKDLQSSNAENAEWMDIIDGRIRATKHDMHAEQLNRWREAVKIK